MTFWRALLATLAKNPISSFAVAMVAVTLGFLIYMANWQTTTLTSHDWCSRAMGAEKVAPGKTYEQSIQAMQGCIDVLKIQLEAIATDSHIDHLTFSFVLILLSGVVIAGVKMAFKVSKEGIEGDFRKDREQAAQHVVEGAQEAADEIT